MREHDVQQVLTQDGQWHRRDALSPRHENLARTHFATRTRHYSTTLAHLRAERTAWRTGRHDTQSPAPASAEPPAGQAGGSPIGDLAGHSTDLAAGHRPSHRNIAGQRVDSDTTLVISHWQYAGTGLLPELEHLADLLAAKRQNRPEQPTRTRRSEHSSDRADHSAGHLVGHSTGRLTGAAQPGALA
ncbi:replication initiator [Streptomyces sp. YIM S03343]